MNKGLAIIILIFIAGTILCSCQSDKNEIQDVALQMKANECRIQKITQYVDKSWNSSIKKLADYLPERLPDQERQNILQLKNADLIRMFESYEEFEPQGQALVDSMELLDEEWADSLRQLSIANQNLGMKMDSLFSMIDDSGEMDKMYEVVDDIQTRTCNENVSR